jgi:hypothetical protein
VVVRSAGLRPWVGVRLVIRIWVVRNCIVRTFVVPLLVRTCVVRALAVGFVLLRV